MYRTPTEWLCEALMNAQLSVPPIANFLLTALCYGGALAVLVNTWNASA